MSFLQLDESEPISPLSGVVVDSPRGQHLFDMSVGPLNRPLTLRMTRGSEYDGESGTYLDHFLDHVSGESPYVVSWEHSRWRNHAKISIKL